VPDHWAIRDIDLFRVLLRNAQPSRQRPSVFRIAEDESIEPSLVSVMMPFAGFGAVYETAFRGCALSPPCSQVVPIEASAVNRRGVKTVAGGRWHAQTVMRAMERVGSD
jgi:hypothetical protein